MLRVLFRLLALLVVALVAYLAFTFVQVWSASRRDEARKSEAIVVLGAAQYDGRPSPVLRARLDHAVDLYERDLADVVVVTGGRRPGDTHNEAGAGADYLRRRGVPSRAVLREVSGRNSWQSLASAAGFLRARGRTEVLLVSDGFHAARIRAMADELGLDAHVSPAPDSPISGTEVLPYLGRETLAMSAGRIVGFRRLMGIDDRVVERVRERVASG